MLDAHNRALPTPTAQVWRQWWRDLPAGTNPQVAARRRGFVLATRDLPDHGVTRSTMRTQLRRGAWWAPVRGVVSPFELSADEPSSHLLARRRHALIAAAGVLARADHVVAGRSAAVLAGLPTVTVPECVELVAPNFDGLGRHARAHTFGALLLADSVTCWHGVLTTSVARTVVDLARHDRFDGIMAVDAALRWTLADPDQLTSELLNAQGWPGVRAARAIIDLADPRAESPLESVTRLRLHQDGFPAPELQFWIGGHRVDMCWPEHRLVLEVDGKIKYLDQPDTAGADALWQEKLRESALRRAGFEVVRLIASDVYRDWRQTSAHLQRLF